MEVVRDPMDPNVRGHVLTIGLVMDLHLMVPDSGEIIMVMSEKVLDQIEMDLF